MRIQRLILVTLFFCFSGRSQTYESHNVRLLGKIAPNVADAGTDGRRYSNCWGWHQLPSNREYAISGTSNGTYFIEVSTPTNPVVRDFVQGNQGCTYREVRSRNNYAYIISDDNPPNGLQIVDMQFLPDSVSLVYSGRALFDRAHSAYIDGSHLYLGAVTYSNGFASMAVYDLSSPASPQLLRKLNQDFPFISLVHDMHVRNDTIYASCADQGLYVFHYDAAQNKFGQLGSFTGYPKAGYNHSSFLLPGGRLVFCDEVPSGLPIHVLNVSNLSNPAEECAFNPHPHTTPHNPYVKGNFLLASCYEDGLMIYDMTEPSRPSLSGWFDTHPQGGANIGKYAAMSFRGNWGNFCWLPSGIILASDMQNGLFILDAGDAFAETEKNYVGIKSTPPETFTAWFDEGNLKLSHSDKEGKLALSDLSGKTVLKDCGPIEAAYKTDELSPGIYLLDCEYGGRRYHQKLIK